MSKGHKDMTIPDKNPYGTRRSSRRETLEDLKSLLEDRGPKNVKSPSKNKETNEDEKQFIRNVLEIDKIDKVNSRLKDLADKGELANYLSGCKGNNDNTSSLKCKDNKPVSFRCYSSSCKTMILVLIASVSLMGPSWLFAEARNSEPRYETAYACEGKTLKIGCGEGSVIHLIRANYGRFSITICNDHGNTEWSVNCMSNRSLRVLHSRCSMHQNCSILASTNMFGDPCPNTLKYLEAHYQCVPASTTSTTNRPSPPWLITSQPTVWRSTAPPIPKNPIQAVGEKKKPTVITPPTFRPHITLPPEVKLGDIGTKTTTRQPEPSSSEREPQTPKETVPETKIEEQDRRVVEENSKPRNDKPSKDIDDVTGATEESIHWKGKEVIIEETGPVLPLPPKEIPDVVDVQDEFDKRFPTLPTPTVGGRAYCTPKNARGLHWNWTLAGTYSVQPCPGGATGLARWRCNLTPAHHSEEEERPRRRSSSLQSGENYLDLGLEAPSERQLQLMRRLGSEALLKGRDGDTPVREYRGTVALPESQASSVNPTNSNDYSYDATPEWHGATPDLSECRSVWLNSLEARVREGESLLSVSSDLAQVTSSKTLYGGDMMTTTNIMRKLVQRMAQNVQTFPDSGQREALVTDMLLGVIKTGSNLLEESQRASWMDLSPEAQNKAASALLTQLEENAFLLADAITSEKNILQTVKNICLSVRVVELRNLEDETFPSVIAQEQWHASENTITIPKAALLENRQKDLVRIVFFSFDRLEEILPPVFGKTPQMAAFASEAASSTSLNTDRQARNMARVINSKVISASLGNGRHIQLSQTVKLTMKHLHSENVTNPICVFWDYTLHGWSPEGCEVEWSNTTHTGCVCSHLTNFAILMDVHGTRLGSDHELALRLLTFIGCAISAVALLAAIVVFQCFRNMKSDRVLIHKNLCACLLIAEVIFMCGIDQTQVRVLCGVIAGLLHYFFLAAFAWMFLEGFHLYAMLVEVFEPERPRARWYCIAAYATPALVVIASAAAYPQGYGTRRHCWLSTDRMFVMSFVGPVALVLAANWICLSMVIYMMCTQSTVSIKAKENSKLYKIRVWLNSSLVLAFLLGLTWTFGLLYLNEQTVGVAYAFTVLNSLQGLFIFIFHCLQNEIFQKECARLGRRHPWLSCCLYFTGQTSSSQPIPNNNAATASSSNHVDTRQGSVKSRRYHQSTAEAEDVVDPRDGITNTSSKHHPGSTATLSHHDTLSRQLAQQNMAPYDCETPPSPRHGKDEDALHHQGYQTTRSYHSDFRNPHVYLTQHSPGSQEMIFRKHYKDDRRKHHHHQNPGHTYQEIAAQQGRIYRRGSEQEFRAIQDDPVYEEIERNETLISDVSDDNSGPDCRQNPHHAKFYGDHRPLISYSPGERHHDPEHYDKYGKWDSLGRNYDRHAYESGRLMGPYHQPQENNMRAFAAVLNRENNVVCHLEPHNSYDVYQPQSGGNRTVSQPSF